MWMYKDGGEERERVVDHASHQESVEPENQLAVPMKELEHPVDDAGCVDALRLELLHYVQELGGGG